MAHGISAHHTGLLLVLISGLSLRHFIGSTQDTTLRKLKYLEETLSKEGVQDLVQGDSIWVPATITEIQSGASIRKYLRKRSSVIASITSERL